jgi:hypothetical protein
VASAWMVRFHTVYSDTLVSGSLDHKVRLGMIETSQIIELDFLVWQLFFHQVTSIFILISCIGSTRNFVGYFLSCISLLYLLLDFNPVWCVLHLVLLWMLQIHRYTWICCSWFCRWLIFFLLPSLCFWDLIGILFWILIASIFVKATETTSSHECSMWGRFWVVTRSWWW